MNIFVVKSLLRHLTIGTVFRGVIPFNVALVALLAIIVAFPNLPPGSRVYEMMRAMDQLEPIEKASVHELRALQLERLRRSLKHAYDRVPHYRKAFDAAGVRPAI